MTILLEGRILSCGVAVSPSLVRLDVTQYSGETCSNSFQVSAGLYGCKLSSKRTTECPERPSRFGGILVLGHFQDHLQGTVLAVSYCIRLNPERWSYHNSLNYCVTFAGYYVKRGCRHTQPMARGGRREPSLKYIDAM
jgi:hypothetical protein